MAKKLEREGTRLPPREQSKYFGKKPNFTEVKRRVGTKNPNSLVKRCIICDYLIPRLDTKGRQLCSIRCMRVYEAREKKHAATLAALARKDMRGKSFYTDRQKRTRRMTRALAKISALDTVTPEQQGKIRREIFNCVKEQLVEANLQVLGVTEEGNPIPKEDRWTATQARLFSTLLAKVLPDAPQPKAEAVDPSRPLSELTREELEVLASSELARVINPAPPPTPAPVPSRGTYRSPKELAEEANATEADASAAPTPEDPSDDH